MMVMPDGTVLVHNLTPALAAVLTELNPEDKDLQQRAARQEPGYGLDVLQILDLPETLAGKIGDALATMDRQR